ncbi:MAG: OmpA family protein [Pseudomonadota bacterium]
MTSPLGWPLRAALAAALVVALAAGQQPAAATDAQDLGEQLPDAAELSQGLFPEDECEELKRAGFKCMGFRHAVRYSLPGASFRVGSADLPELLRRQLDVFAAALSGKTGAGKLLRVEGHADASGPADLNQALSQRRAEAVKHYLVDKGADPAMLEAVGMGSKAPKNERDPYSAVNRRVEIGRQLPAN